MGLNGYTNLFAMRIQSLRYIPVLKDCYRTSINYMKLFPLKSGKFLCLNPIEIHDNLSHFLLTHE